MVETFGRTVTVWRTRAWISKQFDIMPTNCKQSRDLAFLWPKTMFICILYGEILDSWLDPYHVYIGFHLARKMLLMLSRTLIYYCNKIYVWAMFTENITVTKYNKILNMLSVLFAIVLYLLWSSTAPELLLVLLHYLVWLLITILSSVSCQLKFH